MGCLRGGASVVLAESIGSVAGYLYSGSAESDGLGINANHPFCAGRARQGVCSARVTYRLWFTGFGKIEIFDQQGRLCCTSRLTTAIL
ncbi:hypothetical protein ACNKHK_10930 [Shigella flexneri]